ncbi:MAG: hypothetical protein RJA61_126 [Candidatus Parcubacteria bacterium]|jgi:tryptophanyl-tRNA synthetase
MQKKTLLSGVKPTGRPHIGNYFGAMKQYVDLQEDHDSFIFIADFHALTGIQNGKELAQNTLDLAIDYLAIGLDPEKTILFKQSDVPQVTELAWIFSCLSTMPYLMRAHAFKDAEAKNKEINVGTFNYPILMAADILLPSADVVPVGEDQRQHIEIARDMADKFNRTFGETFKIPKELILKNVETVPGIDGKKMSKSYGNTIPLFATREEITKAVMGIVTDSGSDIPENVYAIHELFKSEEELKSVYEANKGKYKALKEILIEDIDAFIAPLRTKREEIVKDIDKVKQILKNGGQIARDRAEAKMREVREKVGLILK